VQHHGHADTIGGRHLPDAAAPIVVRASRQWTGGQRMRNEPQGWDAESDFIFAAPGDFQGYYRGRTHENAYTKSRFSWVILKSHTNNRRGATLNSADPREPPCISFRYFHEGSAGREADLGAVAHAVEFLKRLNANLTGTIADARRRAAPGAGSPPAGECRASA
jgi:hypothetical protein